MGRGRTDRVCAAEVAAPAGRRRFACELAESAPARMRGLLGRDGLEPGHGVLLRPASSVHTAFMRFPIDVVFLDRELRVLKVSRNVPPWRARSCRRARAVLELAAGASEPLGLAPGALVRLD